MTVFLKSGNTTGSPVLDIDVRGDDLVEGVSPAMGAPLFNRAKTRVGVGACFFVTARPPAVGSLQITDGGKKARWQMSDNKPIAALDKKVQRKWMRLFQENRHSGKLKLKVEPPPGSYGIGPRPLARRTLPNILWSPPPP